MPLRKIIAGYFLVFMSGCVGNQVAEIEPEPPELQCGNYPDEQRLRAFDPYLLPNVHSTGGGDETWIIFMNCTDAEVAYYWVDWDGIEQHYGNLEPESEVIQHSYQGHVWVVRDGDGRGLAVFRAAEAMSRAVVSSRG